MRRTFSILTALAGALILTILAASPAQAQTTVTLIVNGDNGDVTFIGDTNSAGTEELVPCDTKDDGYAIIGLLDINGDGYSDIRADTKGLGPHNCKPKTFNVPEGLSMKFWACQIKGDNLVNCTSRVVVIA